MQNFALDASWAKTKDVHLPATAGKTREEGKEQQKQRKLHRQESTFDLLSVCFALDIYANLSLNSPSTRFANLLHRAAGVLK